MQRGRPPIIITLLKAHIVDYYFNYEAKNEVNYNGLVFRFIWSGHGIKHSLNNVCIHVCFVQPCGLCVSDRNWNSSSSQWCVCFEVVPGIRSQGGANPGRLLPWWERIALVCTRSAVRRQRRTNHRPDCSSQCRANCSDKNISYLKQTLSISKLCGALIWPYLE